MSTCTRTEAGITVKHFDLLRCKQAVGIACRTAPDIRIHVQHEPIETYISTDKQQQASEREAAPARPGPELQAQHAGGAQQRLLGKVTLHSDPEAPSAARGRGP
ncbi:hypothetical protein CB1_000880058 [Camelus ferus]|nr:hypothetical protein CB1_000880058 [Camelus ferus]